MAVEIDEELKVYLKTKSAVTDLIGTGTAARIYTHEAKQGVSAPYIVIQMFAGTSHGHMNGISGLARNRFQIDCYGRTKSEAKDLSEAVRLAPLDRYRGAMGAAFAHEVVSDEGDELKHIKPIQGGNSARYAVSRDYFISYQEPTTA